MSKQDDLDLPLLSKDKKSQQPSAQKVLFSPFINYLSSASPPDKYQKSYSLFRFLTFLDIVPTVKKINASTTPPKVEDLPLPYDHFNIEEKVVKLDEEWNREKDTGRPDLIKALYRTFKSQFYVGGLLMFLTFIGRLSSTLMLGKIIDVITSKDLGLVFDPEVLMTRAILFSVIFLASNIINTHFWNHVGMTAASIRMSIVGLSYKKLQTVALSSLQEINIGKVINLLASDLNDIDQGFMHIWSVILSPLLIILSAYLLWDFFGFYTVVSIGGLFGSIFLSQYVSKKTGAPRVAKNAVTDERIKLTNEIVECIRLLKMYSWEKAFKKIAEGLRLKELAALLVLNKVEILGRVVAEMSVNVCSFIMFTCYTLQGGLLTPEKVYTSLMLLNFAKIWCIQFPHQGRVFIVNAKVMRTRVESILTIPEVLSVEEANNLNSHRKSEHELLLDMNNIQVFENRDTGKSKSIHFKNFSAYWNKNNEKACVQDLNLTIHPGQVTAVIGKIGSGKTSFLLSLLREVPVTKGQMICDGTIAYVEQEPIIFSQTVQANILFGLEYDETLYQQVIRACNLHVDFRQLPEGDKTIVGERGVTLSGGQKARLSLARALYSRSDIYLMDDPLSAVDSKVARHLFTYAIKGNLLANKVVVLVTHHLTYAKEADKVIAFDDGKVEAEGTFKELQTMNLDLLNIFRKENNMSEQEIDEEKRKSTRKSTMQAEEQQIKGGKTENFKEEATLVSWSTYKNYILSGESLSLWIAILILYVGYQVNSIGYTRFLGYWAYMQQSTFEANKTAKVSEEFNNTIYVFWGIVLTASLFLIKFYMTVMMFYFAVNTNTRLHNQILAKITRAAVSFFDKTPIGSILNRFSADLSILDKSAWLAASFVLDGMCGIIFSLVTVCSINPAVMIPSAIVIFILIKVRSAFKKPSLESRRLDLISKSPLYSEISATINGLLIIRVFRQGGRFIQNFMGIVYNNSRCFLFQQRSQRLFGMIQDLCAYILTVAGIFLYIHVARTSEIDPGLFGLAIVLILDVCNRSSPIIRLTLEMDLQMQSAQRMLEYTKLPEEAPESKPAMDDHVKRQFQGKWPHRGELVFKDVYMRYNNNQDYVLNGLNFVVKPGMKVGCVGRTGAGKSSLIQVLFRMVEVEDRAESYIKIDGVNIGEIGLDLLRKNLSIIPQTAAIFTGNIRRNLDPFDEYTDQDVWFALEEVNLKSYVERLEKKLDTDMTMSSTIFSAGQKQLICLARALLRSSKIIILDEATANVDIETDSFIQAKINERFKDATVLTVAHRLTTIAHYDRILVMDKGKVAEYDAPYVLLVNNVGDKRITNTEGIFAKMVVSTGESMARRIFEIAHKKYFEQNEEEIL